MGILVCLMWNVLGIGVHLITDPSMCLQIVLGPITIFIGNVDDLDLDNG